MVCDQQQLQFRRQHPYRLAGGPGDQYQEGAYAGAAAEVRDDQAAESSGGGVGSCNRGIKPEHQPQNYIYSYIAIAI